MLSPDHLAGMPPGPGPFPALVLAPGQRYHMRLPIAEQLASQLVPRGIAVFRFDWSGPGMEADVLRTMLALVRNDPRVDAGNIWMRQVDRLHLRVAAVGRRPLAARRRAADADLFAR